MKLTITAKIENGSELKTILNQIIDQYTDGVGSYCLPLETAFGLTADGRRVSRRSAESVVLVEFGVEGSHE